jgi:hypothetical protein
MIRLRRLAALAALVFAVCQAGLVAQYIPSRERVDPNLRRRTEIDGNNVRTSVFNFVFSGRTGSGQGVPYEWPKNTGRVYVALVGLFVGGEVLDDTGHVVRIVDLPSYRQNPANGADWNMNPMPGYFNLQTGKIAKSDDPSTWPAFWPDKLSDPSDPGWRKESANNEDVDPNKAAWNGYFGKNQFSADQEMFYRAGDDNYNRFLYTPDTTDRTRKGLGIVTDVRVLQWSQVSIADAVFFIQAVKNDGTKPIKKAAVTLWLADFVGGDGDSQDDSPDFDLILDIAYSLDADGVSSNPAFQGVCVGAAATIYLETPGNAVDRIDNDGDSPEYLTGPKVIAQMFGSRIPGTSAEIPGNQIDDNHNGLVDEDSTYIPFGTQRGVGFADGIDNNGNGEPGSPTITTSMIAQAATDPWKRWPPNPENDAFAQGAIHLIDVGDEDVGMRFKDNIDNNGDSYLDLPTITQAIIDAASNDAYHRYKVPGTHVILYSVGPEDLGRKYINRDGLRDPHIDDGIDEMIDEGRNDGVDNDGDWNPLTDDVGLDGAPNTHDPGEGDGIPTSGAGTEFPGEPNIDKTDVSEADQIGLTNVQYLAAGAINFSTTADVFFWAEFMIPGSFVDPALIPVGESDLFVSSGVFPLEPGQIERISYSVVFGNAVRCPGNAVFTGAKDDARRKREFAVLAYNEDYQFAQAPIEPKVTAVAGNKRVTLYWDDTAERSVDRFLSGIPGAPTHDFEGYKIYRATDPAFEDARVIRDAYGSPAPWLKSVAEFDLKDGIKGFHPTPFNGVQFYMGNDAGLRHSWTDSSVQNGQKYYYAVRAFDQGYTPLNILPAESNLRISLDPVTGSVKEVGTSVVIVTPDAAAAGYVAPNVSAIRLVAGSTTGTISFEMVDPYKVRDNHTYRITFDDTLIAGSGFNSPDTFRTKNFTLADVTSPSAFDTLINRSRFVADTIEQPITDGFQLTLKNEKNFGLNRDLSKWSRDNVLRYEFQQWKGGFISGLQKPNDYKIVFGNVGVDTSTQYLVDDVTPVLLPAIPVNFKVFNVTENKQIDFAFHELDLVGDPRPGVFSASYFFNRPNRTLTDEIIFLERDLRDSLKTTWDFYLIFDSLRTQPAPGDTVTIVLSKLFRASDRFEFTTKAQYINKEQAKGELSKIKVVPNPYIAAATWEERNPYSSGRGPRAIHFNHLPQQCTIRIYTVSGELVATIEHNSDILDGSAEWNLLTRDNLSVAYGVYIYHVEAPGIGEHVGKFAIIK